MNISTRILSGLCLSVCLCAPAHAATLRFGSAEQDITNRNTVAETRYRMSGSNWDQMLGNGAEKFSPDNLATADLGRSSSLNGQLWDFNLSYENGDSGARGFTFSMAPGTSGRDTGGPQTLTRPRSAVVSTLLFNEKNPLGDSMPVDAFNAIQFEARAGALRDDISKAILEITRLNFYADGKNTQLKDLRASSASHDSERASYWMTSNRKLSEIDWTISGAVQGRFDCGDGSTRCLRDESIKMNMRFAEADVVPLPAAAWLFVSALGALGWQRRNP